MRDAVDIFKKLVFDRINKEVKIKAVIQTTETYQIIQLCSMKWIKKGSNLTYSGYEEIVTNEVLEVVNYDQNTVKIPWVDEATEMKEGFVLTIDDNITLINGTRIVANNEWKLKTVYDVTQGLPLVWLHETIRENFKERNNPIERTVSYRFFLLDEVNREDLNEVKRAGAVRPMYGLLGELKRIMDSKLNLERSGDIQVTSFSYFGTEDQKGIRKAILDADLGGLEVVVDLDILQENCNC